MNITFYRTSSEKNSLVKNLVEVAPLTGALREASSILDPVIDFEGVEQYLDQINYAYIPAFGRYYFITGIESIVTGLWRVSFHVDVLYTYRAAIKQNRAIIERNELEYDLKLNDGLFKTAQNPRIAQFTFPAGFNTWDYVLAIAGN